MTVAAAVAPFPADVFESPAVESGYTRCMVRGELPAGLDGAAYWNGPARFGAGGRSARHWLDGDGMVAALGIDGPHVRFANRFVRTRKWCDETAIGRPLFRCFGTAFAGDRVLRGMALESPANVSVVPFDGALLAFGEQGLPWRIDPDSLETKGQCTFRGAVNEVTPFAAHAKVDPETGVLVNFGVSFDARCPALSLYQFTPDGSLATRRRVPLEWPCSIHDFGLTRHFAVFYASPYLVDVTTLARGGTLLEALEWRPELRSRIVIVDRSSGATGRIPLNSGYCLHIINALEAEGRLCLDVLELDRPVYDQYLLDTLLDDAPRGHAVRYIIDPEAHRVIHRIDAAYERAPDFPVVPSECVGRPYEWFVALGLSRAGSRGRKLYDELVLTRWSEPQVPDIYRAPAGVFFTGEPVVVSRGDDAPHTLLCPMLDAGCDESAVALFAADDIRSGPTATIPLGAALPPAFHGTWVARRAHA